MATPDPSVVCVVVPVSVVESDSVPAGVPGPTWTVTA